MCIICTRCVRACDEIRHTGAITLAGRGFTTRIAFGAGGAIHESNCDFCGACIDVCPTATLLEKPNKWIAKTETWVSTACNSCSVGCTLSMGVRNGKAVMVKPDRLNPVSDDQICVRGRFHYDAIKPRDRLTRHLVREGDRLVPDDLRRWRSSAAIASADAVKATRRPQRRLPRRPLGDERRSLPGAAHRSRARRHREHRLDRGPAGRAVKRALTGAFGTDALPADLAEIATAKTIVVIADDLESSHNVAALRVKDAVVRNGARLVVVSSRYGEVCDFIAPPPSGTIMPSPQRVHSADPTGVWLRPTPGGEPRHARRSACWPSACRSTAKARTLAGPATPPASVDRRPEPRRRHPRPPRPRRRQARRRLRAQPRRHTLRRRRRKAAANIAMLCAGDRPPTSLYVMPTEVNVNGMRDMGAKPGNGGRPDSDALRRRQGAGRRWRQPADARARAGGRSGAERRSTA